MKTLEELIRPNIWKLKPYSSARDEYKGMDGIFLDANENPFGELNRYPDPYQKKLKLKLSGIKSISPDSIFIGNGSDEVIDLALRIFCEPGIDKALTFSPTYGMYEVSSAVNNIDLIKVSLNDNFQIDFENLCSYLTDASIKLIFICSPNNPTGNSIENIEKILNSFSGIVFVDEAYIDFSKDESCLKFMRKYPNLIISQTFSKAFGLASGRIGVAYSSAEIISYFNKVKPPYNISELNQNAALKALNEIDKTNKEIELILTEKVKLIEELKQIKKILNIYPSDANFVLVKTVDANKIYNELVNQKIVTRNRNSIVQNCIRITVGSPEENQKLINALKSI